MELITLMIDFILNIDTHLHQIISDYGVWTYVILFAIVFCETGLVVTPFLPGDSLLFAAGAFAAKGSLEFYILFIVIFVAAVIGDAVNYKIGNFIGPSVWNKKDTWYFKKDYLHKTEKFYEKYGGKAIVIARFVPIVRTFAPFLAGVGRMKYSEFAFYNVSGALLWIISMMGAGYIFGEIPFVKENFSMVVLAIIFLSILPPLIEMYKAKKEKNREKVPQA